MAIDPSTQNIMLGVTANVLTGILAATAKGSRKLLTFSEKIDISTSIQEGITSTSDTIAWEGPGEVEEICLFLQSPQVEALIRQIFATRRIENNSTSIPRIREEFTLLLSHYLDVPLADIQKPAELMFSELVANCDLTLSNAISQGRIDAHEAKSTLRHNLLMDALSTLNKNLEFLRHKTKPGQRALIEFEEKYREQLAVRHGYITPPNFDAAKQVAIDSIYVSSGLLRASNEREGSKEATQFNEFTSNLKRAVVLGNPGGGKSTLSSKLTYDLAVNYQSRLVAGQLLTPVLVILRDYGAQKRVHRFSILQFIESTANSLYQIEPLPGAFEYLFLNGKSLVIFDGLDELLDTHYRQEITQDVEAFSNLYPSTPILVTSREVGYEQAPLNPAKFDTYTLQSFTDNQVQEYVNKWFALDSELTTEEQQHKAQSFFQESRIVADLCANPLMLSLMCNIYRGENYIPTNRPDVYEKCSLMLFERWDKSRGIVTALPIEAHINPAMKYLAHWIYSDGSLQSGVTEKKLIAKATEYLCPRRFEDQDEAERAAEAFIEFCRGRAWVFTDTGTTKEGEHLYQFTHGTFLEYFTAAHIVRTHRTPAEMLDLLLPRIAEREWDVVAQLAFQIQNKSIENAGDELLEKLMLESKSNFSQTSFSLLSFANRSLEFIVPSPKITRELTVATLELLMDACRHSVASQVPHNVELKREAANPKEIFCWLVVCFFGKPKCYRYFYRILFHKHDSQRQRRRCNNCRRTCATS